jgi:DNA-binding NarL/FixJ family response regulator
MPKMDGYELALMARKAYPNLKIVALSMNSDGAYIDKMITNASINGYLLKTINKDELCTALESIAKGNDYFTEEIVSELHQFEKLKQENENIHLTSREKKNNTMYCKKLN